jgi:hypothetical protein
MGTDSKDNAKTMTKEELQAIRERANAATAGPWDDYWETGYEDSHPVIQQLGKPPNCTLGECVVPGYRVKRLDAHFIAAARSDIPKLLDYIAFLEKDRDGYKRYYDFAHEKPQDGAQMATTWEGK